MVWNCYLENKLHLAQLDDKAAVWLFVDIHCTCYRECKRMALQLCCWFLSWLFSIMQVQARFLCFLSKLTLSFGRSVKGWYKDHYAMESRAIRLFELQNWPYNLLVPSCCPEQTHKGGAKAIEMTDLLIRSSPQQVSRGMGIRQPHRRSSSVDIIEWYLALRWYFSRRWAPKELGLRLQRKTEK